MTTKDPLEGKESETLADSPTSTFPQATLAGENDHCLPTLIVQSGPNLGDYFVFPDDAEIITIGRARDADFRIPDTSVSRHHARFREVSMSTGFETRVRDLGSTNGTRVQGESIDGEAPLQDGDVVQVGDVALRYRRMDPTDRAFQAELASKIESARTDPLTGLQTRRFLNDHLGELVEAHQRNARAISLLMIDLDFFKQVNDTFGHVMGDEVLRDVAQLIQSAIRGGDTAVRFGGEEFCVVLPGASDEVALRVAERIRLWVEEEATNRLETAPWVTVSVGVATLSDDEEIAGWMARADNALYRAKGEGRNRVIVARPVGNDFEIETLPRTLADRDTRRVMRVQPQPEPEQDPGDTGDHENDV